MKIKKFARALALALCFMLALGFTACTTQLTPPPEEKFAVLTFKGHTTALSFTEEDDITDAQLLSGVSVTADDGKSYKAAVKDKTALKANVIGEYVVKIGALDADNNWVKKSQAEQYSVNRTVKVVRSADINVGEFAGLTAIDYTDQSFADGKGVYNLKRAQYDAEKKAVKLNADSYLYVKFKMPVYTARHQYDLADKLPMLEYNSSYYVRLRAAVGEAAVQVILYDGATPSDITNGGIVLDGEYMQFRIPDALMGKEITVVVYNLVPFEENIEAYIKEIAIVQESDPKERESYFEQMYRYEVASSDAEKFTFSTASWAGFHGLSRGDVNGAYSASIDGYGANMRGFEYLESEDPLVNANHLFTGTGFWGAVKISADTQKVIVSAGYVAKPVAMKVSLYDGQGFTVISRSNPNSNADFIEPNGGWELVNSNYENQKEFQFAIDESFRGKKVILIVEFKFAGEGAEVRARSVEFSKAAYADPALKDGLDLSTINEMEPIDTSAAIGFAGGYSGFENKRATSAVSGGIQFTPAAGDENLYKAAMVAKLNVPSDINALKLVVSGENAKKASMAVKYIDLVTFDVFDLIYTKNITSGEDVVMLCSALPSTFKGTVGILVDMSYDLEWEPADYAASVTVKSMELFAAEVIAEDGLGKGFSHRLLQETPIETIGADTFNNNIAGANYYRWNAAYAVADPNPYFLSANDNCLELKTNSIVAGKTLTSAYIGTRITEGFIKLRMGTYVPNTAAGAENGYSAKVRLIVYDRSAQTFTLLDADTNNGYKMTKAGYADDAMEAVYYTVPQALQNKDVALILQAEETGDSWTVMVREVSFSAARG